MIISSTSNNNKPAIAKPNGKRTATPKFSMNMLLLKVRCIRKPISAIHFSNKYDLRFRDRSFDVELLLEVELILEVELLSLSKRLYLWSLSAFWICLWWFSVVVIFSCCFYFRLKQLCFSLSDNFVFLIGSCQKVKPLERVKLFYFTISLL